MFISYYNKRWSDVIKDMNESIKNNNINYRMFEKIAKKSDKYGKKTLLWMKRKWKILEELNLI